MTAVITKIVTEKMIKMNVKMKVDVLINMVNNLSETKINNIDLNYVGQLMNRLSVAEDLDHIYAQR